MLSEEKENILKEQLISKSQRTFYLRQLSKNAPFLFWDEVAPSTFKAMYRGFMLRVAAQNVDGELEGELEINFKILNIKDFVIFEISEKKNPYLPLIWASAAALNHTS